MKKIIYTTKKLIYTVALLSSITLVGCADKLDTKPTTSISANEIFSTPERIEGLVNGAYKSLKGINMYGGKVLFYMDVRGEDFINVTGNTYTGFDSWNNSFTSGSNDVTNVWAEGYSAINNANIIIEGLNGLEGVISDQQKKYYLAEAHFIRALSYYTLVNLYAQPYKKDNGQSKALPLRLKAETTAANNDLARSTVEEVYNKIIEDLNFAESNLPESYSSDLLNTTRAQKNTAIALKTRVYLTKGDFDNVVIEAQKIAPQTTAPFFATSGVANALQPDILTIFGSNYVTTESVLSMPFTPSDSYNGQYAIGYIYWANKEYYLNPTGILGNSLWGADDARRKLVAEVNGRFYLKKYAKTSPYVDYIPVIRYSEVLLNYAEALARKANPNLALASELLKAVHLRSDANFVFPVGSLDTPDNFVQTIRLERRIELLGEGFRSNDLLRDLLTIPAKGSSSLQAAEVMPTEQNYIFPYPNTEINSNKLLLQ